MLLKVFAVISYISFTAIASALECYHEGLTIDPRMMEEVVDLACDDLSGYTWGDGDWATQRTVEYLGCVWCHSYPFIVRLDYVGGDKEQCIPGKVKLSKDVCKRMMLPIIETW
jgi:hypothetical protein